MRDRRNDYSGPTAYGHRAVGVKGDVDEGVIVCGSEEIARQRRSYDRDVLIFDPRHDVALLERKPWALDPAAPLVGWALPEEFLRRRRLLEARRGKPGTREYVQVLRRLEDFRLAHVRGAVRDALTLGVIGFDAVKPLTLCRIDHRPPQLDLAQYPHRPAARVATTAAADDLALLGARYCQMLCMTRDQAASFLTPSTKGTPSMTSAIAQASFFAFCSPILLASEPRSPEPVPTWPRSGSSTVKTVTRENI